MRPLTLLAFASVLALTSVQPSRAESPTVSSAVLEKAWANYGTLDDEMKKIYQKALIKLDNADAREKFTDAQNAFEKYRALQGEFVAFGAKDQATGKLLRAKSYSETTEARIAQLKNWIATSVAK